MYDIRPHMAIYGIYIPYKTKLRLGGYSGTLLRDDQGTPCLKKDFQVHLRNDGNVLDLDRCNTSPGDT